MRCLITGGAGFIGSHLVRSFTISKSNKILVIDNLKTGKREYLSGLPGVEFVDCDILDREALSRVVTDFSPDLVYHLAALHYVPYCNSHPCETLRVNVEGTQSLLESLRGTNAKRLVFTSTAAVYPAVQGPIAETQPIGPMDIYGWSKYFGERLVSAYGRKRDVTIVIARLFNVYGPGETNPHLIPEIVGQLQQGARRIELGNLEPARDFIFVEDAISALRRMGDEQMSYSQVILNIGSSQEYKVVDIVDEVSRLLGEVIKIVQGKQRMRKSDRPHLCADVTRACEVLEWTPKYDLSAGLNALLESADIL
jgi:UDP-glucose 4-epimerase